MTKPTIPTTPTHIALIMDGNGRWAKQRGLPRIAGHRKGKEAARKIIEAAAERNIRYLTLFAFGTDNWQRPEDEVHQLMELFLLALQDEVEDLHKNNIRIRFIGERERFNADLLEGIESAERLTRENTGMCLIVAVSYSGRWDITQAAKSLANKVKCNEITPEEIDSTMLSSFLSTADIPEPDLFIRTSGEKRVSNFLLWELAYTELFFTDVLWPDFDQDDLDEAIAFYATRERRFGHTTEQLEQSHCA